MPAHGSTAFSTEAVKIGPVCMHHFEYDNELESPIPRNINAGVGTEFKTRYSCVSLAKVFVLHTQQQAPNEVGVNIN